MYSRGGPRLVSESWCASLCRTFKLRRAIQCWHRGAQTSMVFIHNMKLNNLLATHDALLSGFVELSPCHCTASNWRCTHIMSRVPDSECCERHGSIVGFSNSRRCTGLFETHYSNGTIAIVLSSSLLSFLEGLIRYFSSCHGTKKKRGVMLMT